MTYDGEEHRTHDTPGRRDGDMEQHTIIDKVSNGPRKAMIAVVMLLLTIAGLLGGLLHQSFKLGAWVATQEMHQQATQRSIKDNADAIGDNAEAIRELTETLGVIATNDTLRGSKLEDVERELREHRRASEEQ